MVRAKNIKALVALIVAALLLSVAAGQVAAGQQGGKKNKATKEEKKLEKEARKLEGKADDAAEHLGRDVVFCILAAHTTGVGTAQELRDKFNSLTGLPFGQFVAAVIMADRTDIPLDTILTKLAAGMSLGQIAKESGESPGEARRGFGQFRSELARSMTNPPTRDCFSAGS
jgi:mannitol-specific phosphotransferase system IIBC component